MLDWIQVLEMDWRVENVECLQLCGTIQQQEAQHCPGPGPAWRSEACPGCYTGRYSAERSPQPLLGFSGTCVKGTGAGCWRPCCKTMLQCSLYSHLYKGAASPPANSSTFLRHSKPSNLGAGDHNFCGLHPLPHANTEGSGKCKTSQESVRKGDGNHADELLLELNKAN